MMMIRDALICLVIIIYGINPDLTLMGFVNYTNNKTFSIPIELKSDQYDKALAKTNSN